MPFPEWMSQYEVCFPIISQHFSPARLHITPTGYEKDSDGKFSAENFNRVYGLYVTARFEDDGKGVIHNVSDFVMPDYFESLHQLLENPINTSAEVAILGDDGLLDIRFQPQSDDTIKIVCRTPSPNFDVICLRLQIECFAQTQALSDTREQLKKLLDLVAKINSSTG